MGGGVGETGNVPPWTLKGQFKRLHLHNNDDANDDNKNKEILITPEKLTDCALVAADQSHRWETRLRNFGGFSSVWSYQFNANVHVTHR